MNAEIVSDDKEKLLKSEYDKKSQRFWIYDIILKKG